jgi:hypothetical protein
VVPCHAADHLVAEHDRGSEKRRSLTGRSPEWAG